MSEQPKSSNKTINLFTSSFFNDRPIPLYIFKWTVLCLIVGCCAGSASAFFLESLNWITNFREDHLWLIALLPVAGFFVGLFYYKYGKEVEAGNHLLIETIEEPKKIIPWRMAPMVYLGTIITHLFGGSAGREGTALQMAGSIADQFSKPLRLTSTDRKILIIAAIAAGFGSVFGTPIAGAVFALEIVLLSRLKLSAILPSFAAAFTADLVSKAWHTQHTAYHINLIPNISFVNVLYTVLAGILFGCCAAIFIKGLHISSNFFKSTIAYPPFRPMLAGILIALAVWLMATTKYIGLGIPIIELSFTQHLPAQDFLLKMAFTILTLSAGFKGGEVTALFFIGAALASALSLFIPLPTALLAGMGFVAVFAGATNTPIASSIMAMELFGVNCAFFVIVACFVSYFLSGRNSIYKRSAINEFKKNIDRDKDFLKEL